MLNQLATKYDLNAPRIRKRYLHWGGYPPVPPNTQKENKASHCISVHLEVQVGVGTGQNGSTHGNSVSQDKLEGVNNERSVPKISLMDLGVICGMSEKRGQSFQSACFFVVVVCSLT